MGIRVLKDEHEKKRERIREISRKKAWKSAGYDKPPAVRGKQFYCNTSNGNLGEI